MENPSPVVNDREAARFLGLGVQTLRQYRHLRKGPKFIKIFGRVLYKISDLEEFLKANTVDPGEWRAAR